MKTILESFVIVLCKRVKIWRLSGGLPEIYFCVYKSCFLEFEILPGYHLVSEYCSVIGKGKSKIGYSVS